MSKKSSVDSNNYYLYPEWFEGGNQSQPSTSSYSYPTLEYIWSNAVRLTRTVHSNLQDEIEYLEKNISGGGGSCNCSELQYGIDKNSTKIYYNSVNITSNANKIGNLSAVKLSRDGSQSMTGILKCESGIETSTIFSYSGDTIECADNLKLDGDLVGDPTDGLNLIAEDTTIASRIQLTPGSNSKILLGTFSGQSVIPRIEIPEGSGNVSITIRGAHLIPYTDSDQDLGTSDKKWKNIYANTGSFTKIDALGASVLDIDDDIKLLRRLWGKNDLYLAGGDPSFGHAQIRLFDRNSLSSPGALSFLTTDSVGAPTERIHISGDADKAQIDIKNADIIPYDDNSYDLGSIGYRWKNVYAAKGNFSGVVIPDNLINTGPYSAIVYKDDTGVYAKDASGNIISQGTADTDDVDVIHDAIAAGTKTKNEVITPEFSTFDDMDDPIGSGWTALQGDETLSQDVSDKKEGTASLKIVGGTSDNPGTKKVGNFDWSAYSVFEFYVKGTTGAKVCLELSDGSGTNYLKWETYLRAGGEWEKIEFDLTTPVWKGGNLSLSDFTIVEIYIQTSTNNYTFRLDYLVLNNWYALSEPFIHETSEVVKNNGVTYTLNEDYELDITRGMIKTIPLTTSIISGNPLNITYDYGRISILLFGNHFKPEGNLYFDKSFLTVEGLPAEAGVSIIDFQGPYSIIINRSYVNLKNLSLMNSGCSTLEQNANLIKIPTTRFVKHNIKLERLFFESAYRGILIESDKTSFEIQNLRIDSCIFKNLIQNPLAIKDEIVNGISVTNCKFIDSAWHDWGAGVVIENVNGEHVVFDNCYFENIGDTALHIEANLHYVSITNCVFYRNGKQGFADGLVISLAGDVTVSNCFFKENDKYGIMLWDNGPVNIIGCIFYKNRQGGIANVKNARIIGNVFYSTGFAGSIASENSITGNKFIECNVVIGNKNMVLNNHVYNAPGHGIDLGGGISSAEYNVIGYNIVKNCKYSGIVLRPESKKSVVIGNICVDNNQANLGWIGGITAWNTKRNLILGNLCYQEDSVNYHQNYGISLWYDSGSVVQNNLVNAIQRKGSGPAKYMYDYHSELFMDVRAQDVDYIHDAITPDGGEHTDTTNPDVPRNVMIRITNTDSANPQTPDGGDIVIEGMDARGISISETLTVPNSEIAAGGTSDIFGSKAFSTVTKITYYSETNSNITVSIGISDKLGLSNLIYSTTDVYKVKKNNADIGVPTVDVTNRTVDCATITDGDDFTIYYRSSLNVID